MESIPGTQFGSVLGNASIPHITLLNLREKNPIIISINAKKDFDKSQHRFMITTLKKRGIEEYFLNKM